MTTDTYISDEVDETKLKPCPFCGGEARRFDFDYNADDPNFGGSMIECSHCEACTAVEFNFKETLYARWNSRPGERAAVREGMERAAKVAEEADVYWNGVAYDRRQSGRDDSFACASASSAVKIASAGLEKVANSAVW